MTPLHDELAIGASDPDPLSTPRRWPPPRPRGAGLSIQRITGRDDTGVVDAMLAEYLPWIAQRYGALYSVPCEHLPELIDAHRREFLAKLPALMTGRARLLLARLDGAPVGMAALEPMQAHVGEIKRMYVRPAARGRGIARALMQRLIRDASHEGFQGLRLETLCFMPEAQALYRSLGFVDCEPFRASKHGMPPPPGLVRSMARPIRPPD